MIRRLHVVFQNPELHRAMMRHAVTGKIVHRMLQVSDLSLARYNRLGRFGGRLVGGLQI